MKRRAIREVVVWAVIVWTFFATLARGIRMPNDYAEAHWLLDYQFGFIKRGLVGAICHLVTDLSGIQMSPYLISILSAVILFMMSAAFLYLLYRVCRWQQIQPDATVLTVIWVSSPFVVMSGHLIGYFDSLIYLFTIISIGLVFHGRPYLASCVSAVALFVHESFLLTGLPLVWLASVAVVAASDRPRQWKHSLIALCVPLAVFLIISTLPFLTTDHVLLRQQIGAHLDSFGFVPTRSHDIALWHTTTLLEFWQSEHHELVYRLLSPRMWFLTGPTLLVLFVCIHAWFRIRVFSPFSMLLIGVVCLPLAIHALAWDTVRIATYPLGSALITLWILVETRTIREQVVEILPMIALPAMAVNILGKTPLMDTEMERFSIPMRAIIYFPAMVLISDIAIRQFLTTWWTGFQEDGISGPDSKED